LVSSRRKAARAPRRRETPMSNPRSALTEEAPRRASSVRDQLQVLRRRKWILLQALIIVPAVAVALSSREPARYQADAQVLLTSQSLAGLATNTPDPNASRDPVRTASTQAALARVPAVLDRTLASAHGTGLTRDQLDSSSSVSAATDADILTFVVTAATPELAARLATAYAQAYTAYRREIDNAALRRARNDVGLRIAALRGTGKAGSALAAKLAVTQSQLQTLETLQSSNATVVNKASGAAQVAPTPVKDGIVGLAIGLIIGLGLVLLVEALDTRVRSGEEVADRLGVPLLGRVPEPPRKLRERHGLVMLDEPYGRGAEAFRMLRTNVGLANIEFEAKVIAVASALPDEGKSTTIANLAVALARGGQRVALVDLDLRQPSLAKFFEPSAHWGVTDVALGHVALDDALLQLDVREFVEETNGASREHHPQLDVLVAGQVPPNPGEFISSRRLASILGELRTKYDVVLIDTPPIFSVGDALALSAHIDAFMLVSHLGLTRRGGLHDLRGALAFARCEILGTVVTAATGPDAFGYVGGQYGYGDKGADRPERAPTATSESWAGGTPS
jgi:succinoglycan biosynthesis transport protein ExoP